MYFTYFFFVSEISFRLSVPSYIISCHNCGHGTDMRGCPQSPLVPEGMYISYLNVNVLVYPLVCWRYIFFTSTPIVPFLCLQFFYSSSLLAVLLFLFFVCSSFVLLLIWSLWSLLQLLFLFSFTSLIMLFSTMTLNCCIRW